MAMVRRRKDFVSSTQWQLLLRTLATITED
jgi:hypothetical protein